MKKIISVVLAIVLFASVGVTGLAKNSQDFNLHGTWNGTDSTYLRFEENGYFKFNWGFGVIEVGTYSIGEYTSENSFAIDLQGTSLILLMKTLYGFVDKNYHFEILIYDSQRISLSQVLTGETAESSRCKLILTRGEDDGDSSITSSLPNNSIPNKPVSSTVKPVEEKTDTSAKEKEIKLYIGEKDNTVKLSWGWDLFNKPSTKDHYDHNLAKAALILSQSIYNSSDDSKNHLSELGFENFDPHFYSDEQAIMHPAHTLASKVVNFNGQKKLIIALTVRGTTGPFLTSPDWLTNTSSLIHHFKTPAENIDSSVDEYYKKYGNGFDKSNTVLFVTGHSLGAAVSNVFSAFFANKYADEKNVFTYCFATPYGETDKDNKHENIFNIINVLDVVTIAPLFGTRNGTDLIYNAIQSDIYNNLSNFFSEERWKELTHNEKLLIDDNILLHHDTATYLCCLSSGSPKNAESVNDYPSYNTYSVCCPVDVEVYDSNNKLMASTSGEKVSLTDDTKVLIYMENDEKHIIYPEGIECTVKLKGTDNGKMTIHSQNIKPITNKILSKKDFNNIALTPNKRFMSQLNEKTDADEVKLFVVDEQGNKLFEVTPDGKEVAVSENFFDSIPTYWYFIIGGIILVIIATVVIIVAVSKKRKKKKRISNNDTLN